MESKVVARIVRTQELQILNEDEELRAILKTQYGLPLLIMFDEKGRQRIEVHFEEGYPAIVLLSPDENLGFSVTLSPDGTVRMGGLTKEGLRRYAPPSDIPPSLENSLPED